MLEFCAYHCTVLAEISQKDRILESMSFTVTRAAVNCTVSKKKRNKFAFAYGDELLPRWRKHKLVSPPASSCRKQRFKESCRVSQERATQWTALEHFFLAAYVEDKLVSASRCLEIMRNPYNKAYLFFLRFSLKSITVFYVLF